MARSRPVTSTTVPGGGTGASGPRRSDQGHGDLDRLPSGADPLAHRAAPRLASRRLPHRCGPDRPARPARPPPRRGRRRSPGRPPTPASGAAVEPRWPGRQTGSPEQEAADHQHRRRPPGATRRTAGTAAMTATRSTRTGTHDAGRAAASWRATIDCGSDSAQAATAAPSQAPPAGPAGGRRSHADEVAHLRHDGIADPRHLPELLDGPEGPVRRPPRDDAAGDAPARRRAAPPARWPSAVLRSMLTGAGPDRRARRRAGVPPCHGRAAGAGPPGSPTTTCSPSTRTRARLTESAARRRVTPPASATASATRAPSGSRTSPGRRPGR